jgi:hypothetical protein
MVVWEHAKGWVYHSSAKLPHIAVLHGTEHIVLLFCKDTAKLTPVHIVVLKSRFVNHMFYSGSMHQPCTLFTKCAKKSLIMDARLAY